MLQITDNAKEQQLLPFFRLAFRPFFLASATFALLSVLIWGLLLSGRRNKRLGEISANAKHLYR